MKSLTYLNDVTGLTCTPGSVTKTGEETDNRTREAAVNSIRIVYFFTFRRP